MAPTTMHQEVTCPQQASTLLPTISLLLLQPQDTLCSDEAWSLREASALRRPHHFPCTKARGWGPCAGYWLPRLIVIEDDAHQGTAVSPPDDREEALRCWATAGALRVAGVVVPAQGIHVEAAGSEQSGKAVLLLPVLGQGFGATPTQVSDVPDMEGMLPGVREGDSAMNRDTPQGQTQDPGGPWSGLILAGLQVAWEAGISAGRGLQTPLGRKGEGGPSVCGCPNTCPTLSGEAGPSLLSCGS